VSCWHTFNRFIISDKDLDFFNDDDNEVSEISMGIINSDNDNPDHSRNKNDSNEDDDDEENIINASFTEEEVASVFRRKWEDNYDYRNDNRHHGQRGEEYRNDEQYSSNSHKNGNSQYQESDFWIDHGK
jgi:hypothetical protein